MTYAPTGKDLESITDAEVAFSTEKLLPKMVDIPDEFHGSGNIYTKIASAVFFGSKLPDGNVSVNDGIDEGLLFRAVRAHLGSWAPKHEHKIAGVGYMISKFCTIKEAA